jgi:hypothetical protein
MNTPLHTSTYSIDRAPIYEDDREKKTVWITFSHRRILSALGFVAATLLIVSGSIGGFFGLRTYDRLVFPHKTVHASKASIKDGSRVVKPYFAPAKYRGVSEKASLVMTVWFREGIPLPPLELDSRDYWRWRRERENEDYARAGRGEQGYIRAEVAPHNDWEVVWRGEMQDITLSESTDVKVNVTLSYRIV